MAGLWRMINLEGNGRGRLQGAIPVSGWENCGQVQKISVITAGLQAESRNLYLPNRTQKC